MAVRSVYIYGLVDPRADEVRYVGKSTKPERRLIEHCMFARRHPKNHRDYWIRSMLSAGVRPTVRILEEVDESQWEEAERRHIAALRAAGVNLTNSTSGGEGWASNEWHPNTHLTPGDIEDILRRVIVGEPVEKLAQAFCIAKKNLYKMIHGDTWSLPELEGLRVEAESVCNRSGPKLTAVQVIEVRRLYAGGMAATMIAQRFGLGRRTIYGITNGAHWRNLPVTPDSQAALLTRRSRGERHGRATLSDDQVRAIRTLSANGVKGTELSLQFGVGRAQISRIINGIRRSSS